LPTHLEFHRLWKCAGNCGKLLRMGNKDAKGREKKKPKKKVVKPDVAAMAALRKIDGRP